MITVLKYSMSMAHSSSRSKSASHVPNSHMHGHSCQNTSKYEKLKNYGKVMKPSVFCQLIENRIDQHDCQHIDSPCRPAHICRATTRWYTGPRARARDKMSGQGRNQRANHESQPDEHCEFLMGGCWRTETISPSWRFSEIVMQRMVRGRWFQGQWSENGQIIVVR